MEMSVDERKKKVLRRESEELGHVGRECHVAESRGKTYLNGCFLRYMFPAVKGIPRFT